MNKKNSGFTLVELIGIVVILALVFLVTYPNIVLLSKNENKKKYEVMVKDLCLAGESYIYAEGVDIIPNQSITVSIQDLVDKGYVEKNLKDVRTNQYVKNNTLTYTVGIDKSLECNY